jgi:DNA (cytosine-5)-methyltransferase 1
MIYADLCTGIAAAAVAWHPLGWRAAWHSEIAPFPCAVLTHHYPAVPNYGDMNAFKEWPDATVDILVGGTPCQAYSVAGLRGGLDDPRGQLMLVYLAVARRYAPRWLVWENVPGVLSSNGGRDFGTFLGGLAELGYGFAYRVLDAQFFGVAQRRRRVFVVGHSGDWRPAAAVLFERESLLGYPAPRRETRQDVASDSGPSAKDGFENGTRFGCNGGAVAHTLRGQSNPSHREDSDNYVVAHALRCEGFDATEDGTGRGIPLVPVAFDTTQVTSPANFSNPTPGDPCHPLASGARAPAVAVPYTLAVRGRADGRNLEVRNDDVANALVTPNGGRDGVGIGALMTPTLKVRRLTPRECERLQGFPDDYTLISARGKPAADGPRYRALGNSMAVPVMHWIGRRMQMVDHQSDAAGYRGIA